MTSHGSSLKGKVLKFSLEGPTGGAEVRQHLFRNILEISPTKSTTGYTDSKLTERAKLVCFKCHKMAKPWTKVT